MDTPVYENIKVEGFGCENIVGEYMCKYCDFVTDLRITLYDHTWRYHVTRDYCKSEPKIEAYTCNNCDFTSYSLLVRLAHEEAHVKLRYEDITSCYIHLEDFFYCRLCEYKSKYLVILKRHLNSHNIYRLETHSKKHLNRHIASRHRDLGKINWFDCDRCEYKARYRSNLKIHIKMRHNRENLLQCRHCSYTSTSKGDLEAHIIRRHTDPLQLEWFKCEQCEYKAQYYETLKNHIKMKHSPENIIQCSHCPYRSAHKNNFKNHFIAHHTDPTEIMWFECDQCEYKGKHIRHLKKHIKTKHCPENVVQCSHCLYRTAIQDHLKRHIITHHTGSDEIKWFVCGQCDYRAKLKFHLTRHIKKVHFNGN